MGTLTNNEIKLIEAALEQMGEEVRQPRPKRAPPPGVPDLADVPVKKQARVKGRFARAEEDPRNAALTARCRAQGKKPTKENRLAMAAVYNGDDFGRCIGHAYDHKSAQALWSFWQAFCMAERTYRLRIIGHNGDPQGAAIGYYPDRVEVDEGHTVDLRSPEQKDEDAVTNWMRWQGYLGCLSDKRQVSLLKAVERSTSAQLWDEKSAKPTVTGVAAVWALEKLADQVKGE